MFKKKKLKGAHLIPLNTEVRQVSGYTRDRASSLIPRCEVIGTTVYNFTTDATIESFFFQTHLKYPVCFRVLGFSARLLLPSGVNTNDFNNAGSLTMINARPGPYPPAMAPANVPLPITFNFVNVTAINNVEDHITWWMPLKPSEIYRPASQPGMTLEFEVNSDGPVTVGFDMRWHVRMHFLGYDLEQVERNQFSTSLPVIDT